MNIITIIISQILDKVRKYNIKRINSYRTEVTLLVFSDFIIINIV